MDPRVSALTLSDSISRKKLGKTTRKHYAMRLCFLQRPLAVGCRGCEQQGPTLQGGGLCMEQRTAGQVPALVPHFLFLLGLARPPGVTQRSK